VTGSPLDLGHPELLAASTELLSQDLLKVLN
jgi:hypothetical protein